MIIINVGIIEIDLSYSEFKNPTPEITYIILNIDIMNPNLLVSETSSVKCSSSSYFLSFSKFRTYS
jgi:hypothetical protein